MADHVEDYARYLQNVDQLAPLQVDSGSETEEEEEEEEEEEKLALNLSRGDQLTFLAYTNGKSFDENQGAISDHEHILTGQDKKANTLVVEHISSTDISTVGIDYSSPSSDLDFNSGVFRSLPVESSSNLFLEEKVSHRLKGHDEKVKDVAENAFLSTEVSTMEGSSINFDLNTDENSYMPVELSVLEEKTSSNLQVEDEKVNKMVEDVAFSNEGKKHYSWSSNPDFNPTDFKSMPIESPISLSLEERPSYNLKDQDEKIKNNDVPLYSSEDSRMPTEFSANSSLEEKVTKFIQNGDLDMIEDNAYGILNERVAEESKEFIKLQNSVVQPAEEHSGNSLNGGSVAVTLNGSTLTSKDVTPAALVTQPLSPSFAMKNERIDKVEEGEEIEEEMEESRETLLYSFTPLPLFFMAALPGAGAVRSLFGPFVELIKSWNLLGWLVHWGGCALCYGWLWNISRFPYTFSDDVEKAMAKDLHPKLLAGMFFFFALGATGGITALLTSDKPIFESPHAVTGLTGLALLTLQATLPALFEQFLEDMINEIIVIP
uniref:Uncharacterized protein n=1 Tax=Quercus lobata TaxID=97700 RepID=A0A7N2L3Q5_QUELO